MRAQQNSDLSNNLHKIEFSSLKSWKWIHTKD